MNNTPLNILKGRWNCNGKTKTCFEKINIVKENNSIRSEMLPTMLKVVNENKNLVNDFGIFEVGRVVTGLDENKNVIEKKHLGLALYSTLESEKELYFKVKAEYFYDTNIYYEFVDDLPINYTNTSYLFEDY